MTKSHNTNNIQDIQLKMEQYCAYQDRCKYEVEQKLKGFDLQYDEVTQIIQNLLDHKFINETRYALSYTRGSYRYKKWGWNKIKMNLVAKKIDGNNLNLAYLEINQEEYIEMITAELSKKWLAVKGKSEFDKTNKLIRFGISRGYEYDYIMDIIPLLKDL